MFELGDILQEAFIMRALLASAMVGIMCGILGCFIILRNMALIGDALSHAILPGVVAGFIIAGGYSTLGFFVGSVIAGLVAALFMTWIQRNVKTQEDAAIGIVFTAMFAIGVMGISYISKQEGIHLDLKDFLFGNILGIADQDLWMTFLVMCFTLISVVAFYRFLFITTFESVVAQTIGISVATVHYFLLLLLSFAVVASLQSVGVILVVAMLITPASTAYLLTHDMKKMILIAAGVGLFSTTAGLLLAIVFDTTPGPAMTVMATLFYLVAVLFAPRRGLVSRYFKRRERQIRILREDVLKQSVRLHERQKLSPENLSERLGMAYKNLRSPVRFLKQNGFLVKDIEGISLTEKGIEKGYDLIRAHRLWESYLVQELGLDVDQIHEDAEKYEHILPESLIEEVAKKLGYPDLDPHGSPIPHKYSGELPNLTSLVVGDRSRISSRQPDHLIRSRLWEMGLVPDLDFEVKALEEGNLKILQGEKMIQVDHALAERIWIAEVVSN